MTHNYSKEARRLASELKAKAEKNLGREPSGPVPVIILGPLEDVPTEPGLYRDYDGCPWMLTQTGKWYDKYGDTRPRSMNHMLAPLDLKKAE